MRITAQELIDELKKLPPYSEIEFSLTRKPARYQDPETIDAEFDRIIFAAKPVIELVA